MKSGLLRRCKNKDLEGQFHRKSARFNGFSGQGMLYFSSGQAMTARPEIVTQNSTAAYIRGLAAQHHVNYVQTPSDQLALHMTRLADDAIRPDEVECMLFALHRAGHLSRQQLVHLQVKYLREAKP
jgi:hypothetical protein